MKMLRNLRLPSLIASAAIAGLCVSAAYAVPNYTPATNSPLNAPNADGVADLSSGLNAINVQLIAVVPNTSLVLPRANVPAAVNAPTKVQFKDAVVDAFEATSSVAEKAEILRAALFASAAYKFSNDKDVVRAVMTSFLNDIDYNVNDAVTILEAGLVPNVKPADLMSGAILAIGDATNTAREADAPQIASAVVTEAFAINTNVALKAESLIQTIATNAITNIKTVGTTGAGFATGLSGDVTNIAQEIMSAAVSAGGGFILDNAARGIMKGAKGLSALSVTYTHALTGIVAGVGADPINRAHAIAGSVRDISHTDTPNLNVIKAAFANPMLDPDLLLDAVVDGHAQTQAVPSGPSQNSTRATNFGVYAGVNPTKAAHYALGGVGLNASLAPLFVTSGMSAIPATSDKMRLLSFVARAAQSKAAVSAGNSVLTGGLTYSQALNATLPNVTVTYSGAVASAVGKAVPTETGQNLITEAINALETASANAPEDDFKAGVVDVTTQILKLKRSDAVDGVLTGGLAAADVGAGTKEAVAAAIGLYEPKVDHQSAIETAMGNMNPELASVQLAEEVAREVKSNSKLAVQTTLGYIRNATPSTLAAAVIGGGLADPKSAHIYMASALRVGNGSLSSGQEAQILKNAKAVSKKTEFDIQLAYDTAKSVLANTDQLFEIVDHQLVKHPKQGAKIAGAAAAAAPEYAHYVARAAGFRSTTSSVGTIPLEIIKGADMNANPTSNPSAVAAIGAGFISGIIDSKQPIATQTKLLQSGMTALVKAAITYGSKGILPVGSTPGSGAFRGVNLTTGLAATGQPEYGSAAVVTGAVSVLTTEGATGIFDVTASSTNPLTILLRAAGKAAGAAQKAVIAQAAAQAAVWASGVHDLMTNAVTAVNAAYDINAIALAITQGLQNNPSQLSPDAVILAAAAAGKAEALLGYKGAGAAGVLDYAHFNTNNSPVTDISNF